jgi:hypothetical protein
MLRPVETEITRATSSRLRRSIPAVLVAILGVVAFTAAPALADTPPSVTIEPASAVGYTTAHVSGTVNPNGGPSATAWAFEYSKNPEAEGWTPAGGGEFTGIEATETTPIAVQTTLEGLQPNTAYQVRLVATNAGGETISAEPNPSFTTKEVAKPTVTPITVSAVTASTAHFSATVNPNAPGPAPGQDPAFNTAWHFRCTPACPAAEGAGEVPATNAPQEVGVTATGLVPTTMYLVELLASNLGGEAITPVETFTTPAAAPVISGESFSEAGSASVRLSGKVNPGGSATSYQFEYGASTGYGSTTTTADAGPGVKNVGVTGQLSELKPETLYHFRLTASNEKGETHGTDETFQTSPTGLLGLPDERGYELVSPTNNGNADVYQPEVGTGWVNALGSTTELPFEAAADGSALAYVAEPPPEGGGGSAGPSFGNEYLARRSAAGRWTSADIQPPMLVGPAYEAFSSNLSLGILDSHEQLGGAAPAGGYDDLYSTRLTSGAYSPLISTAPPHRTIREFEAFGVGQPATRVSETLGYAGASADLSHLLFEANDELTAESVDGGREANNLYDSVGGVLRSVNVLPDGKPEANATFGGAKPEATEPHGVESVDFERVISSDGSRIFWTDLTTNEIYVRENDATSHAATVPVGNGQYRTASTDGSKVFYTSKGTLYRYDLETATTTDLSVDPNLGEEPGVQGVVGASEDGSYVYFVATGRLAAGATAGQPNLYVTHGGEVRPAAVLSLQDDELYPQNGHSFGDWLPNLGDRTAEVTSDGRHVAFVSVRPLTGYENGGPQVFVYDAVTGGLSCSSCNPTGELPRTQETAHPPLSLSNTYQQRWISADGTRVFFDTREALVPQDTNGQVDVYEWEHDGAGSCRRAAGCIYLLSGGASTSPSYFLDASASGNDVFIVTRAQLVSADKNEMLDAYDVRVGASEPPAAPACMGSGCQGLPGPPPTFAAPSSSTFTGAGNYPPAPPAPPAGKPPPLTRAQKLAKALKACQKVKSKKKRAACKKSAHKKYGTAAAKNATTHRRAR